MLLPDFKPSGWPGFDDERKSLNPRRVEALTPAMAKLLAERVSASILGMAEKLRKEPELARWLLQAARPFRIPDALFIGPYEPGARHGSTAPGEPRVILRPPPI